MAKVSISEAARLAGISRQTLYVKYINPGIITVERDGDSRLIDTSDLLREFKSLQETPDTSDSGVGRNMTSQLMPNDTALQEKVDVLQQQLTGAQHRETWLQGQVDHLTSQLSRTTLVLEDLRGKKELEPMTHIKAVYAATENSHLLALETKRLENELLKSEHRQQEQKRKSESLAGLAQQSDQEAQRLAGEILNIEQRAKLAEEIAQKIKQRGLFARIFNR